jgi:hypothetical protein
MGTGCGFGSPKAAPDAGDLTNIDLSMRVVAGVGDSTWPNWSKTPFVVDLLTSNGPVMVNADEPSLAHALKLTVTAIGTASFDDDVKKFLAARTDFQKRSARPTIAM